MTEQNSPTSATVFRRETIPVHSTMAENPHYEAHHSSSTNDSKEDRDQVSMPLLVQNRKPEYKVIASSCLHSLKDLGEGVFGKVHLSTYCPPENPETGKFLVAVSMLCSVLRKTSITTWQKTKNKIYYDIGKSNYSVEFSMTLFSLVNNILKIKQ